MVERLNRRTTWIIVAAIAAVAVAVGVAWGVSAVGGSAGSPGAGEDGQIMDDPATESLAPDASTIGGENDAATEQEIAEFVPNEVIVSVSDPTVLESLTPGASIGNATVLSVETIAEDDGESVVKLTLEGDESVDSTVDALNAMEGVAAQKNFVYHLM